MSLKPLQKYHGVASFQKHLVEPKLLENDANPYYSSRGVPSMEEGIKITLSAFMPVIIINSNFAILRLF